MYVRQSEIGFCPTAESSVKDDRDIFCLTLGYWTNPHFRLPVVSEFEIWMPKFRQAVLPPRIVSWSVSVLPVVGPVLPKGRNRQNAASPLLQSRGGRDLKKISPKASSDEERTGW